MSDELNDSSIVKTRPGALFADITNDLLLAPNAQDGPRRHYREAIVP